MVLSLLIPVLAADAGTKASLEGFRELAVQKLTTAVELYSQGRFLACESVTSDLNKLDLLNRDVATLIRCQCLFYVGRKVQAYECFKGMQSSFPDSHLRVLAAYRTADCAAALGKTAEAARRYQQAAKSGSDPRIDPAVGLFFRARFVLQAGDLDRTRKIADELRGDYPDHPLADSLVSMIPDTELKEKLALRMASKLHEGRKWDRALGILDQVRDPIKAKLRSELAYRTGRILFDMRDHYQEAYRLLSNARDHASDEDLAQRAWFYASRALGRLDRDDAAIASHLAMAERYPDGRLAGRALFYAGWLETNRDRCDQAIPLLLKVTKNYPRTTWADQARWFVAWCQLQKEQWKAAVETLASHTAFPDTSVGAQANYWTGVAYQAMGFEDRALNSWRKTITAYPLTWYALLARARLGKQAPPVESPKPADTIPPIKDRLFAQIHELSNVGLDGMAVRLLRQNEKLFISRHRTPSARYALMSAYHRIGHYHRPWYLAIRREKKNLRSLPEPTTRLAWEFSYPLAVVDLAKDATGSNDRFTLFLAAIMRTESGFDPLAQSVADARGLMQMTPQTAEKIAKQMGIPYDDKKLFDSEYNLRMAGWYIDRLAKKFHHQWPIVASAYNAGSSAMKNWCKNNGHLKLDAFIEAIPWSESRRYAKRVTAAFARYAYLSGFALPELSLDINPDYLKDGLED